MKDNRLQPLSGKSLKELNAAEARGWVIERMNQIESRIDFKITGFFKAKEKDKFKNILLNSSIISLGGKLKILAGCELLDMKTINHIRELSSIRNAFAHAIFVQTAEVTVDKENKSSKIRSSYNSLDVMNSKGVLKRKKVHEHLIRFYDLNEKVRKAL